MFSRVYLDRFPVFPLGALEVTALRMAQTESVAMFTLSGQESVGLLAEKRLGAYQVGDAADGECRAADEQSGPSIGAATASCPSPALATQLSAGHAEKSDYQ